MINSRDCLSDTLIVPLLSIITYVIDFLTSSVVNNNLGCSFQHQFLADQTSSGVRMARAWTSGIGVMDILLVEVARMSLAVVSIFYKLYVSY